MGQVALKEFDDKETTEIRIDKRKKSTVFGEFDSLGWQNGRCITINYADGMIQMGYYSKGKLDVGNYIWIERDGKIGVGEAYLHSNRE